MYENLVNQLREAEQYTKDTLSNPYRFSALYGKSADVIEKLIEVIQNHDFLENLIKHRWIPMTERPPEEELAFYQCYTDAGLVIQCLWTNNRTGLGPLGEWGWRFIDVPSHQKITHWMPLPEPPKEE